MFSKGSRYRELPHHVWRSAEGVEVVYVGRRPLPRSREIRGDRRTVVGPGERLDLVTHRVLGQPEDFWRLCDANGVLDPFDVSGATGRVLRIPEE